MAKLQKLLDEGIEVKHENFVVIELAGREVYVDNVSSKLNDPYTIRTVIPIAETDKFFYYICGNCLEIHVESKRYLNVDNLIGNNGCKILTTMSLPVRYVIEKNDIAFRSALDTKLEREWNYMQNFEK